MKIPVPAAQPPVVLVVDDSPEYLEVLGNALAPMCRVKVAHSGRRALDLALQHPRPDVVVLDVLMPDMNGHEVLAQLRAEPQTAALPVIFLTSLEETGHELAALEAGAADFLTKPVPPAVVRARVRTQLQLKQARDELQQRNDALQGMVAELDAFSYTLSHDLRAPLDVIGTFAGVLAEREGAALSEAGRKQLDRIVRGSRRMTRMIDDVLACARADRARLQPQRIDLDALAAECAAELGPAHPGARIALGPLGTAHGDPCLVRQVLDNLVGNALKFSANAAAPEVEVRARAEADRLVVEVLDNGCGFDAAYAGRLFGLFQRLHTESEYPGCGAGLAIVKRIVARHGGEVFARSAPGERTCFGFTLPHAAGNTPPGGGG